MAEANERGGIIMKKNILILPLIIAALFGCSTNTQNTEAAGANHLGPENTYTIALDENNLVVPQNSYAESSVDLSSYDNILEKATEIVYGEVEEMANYNGVGGTAWIKERVRIIESYKGKFQEGDTIYVIQQTGYISGADFIDSCPENEREHIRKVIFENISDDDLERLIIDQTKGIPLDEVGDRIVFCLWKSSQSTDDVTYYEPVGDWAGKQVEIEGGEFAQYFPSILSTTRGEVDNRAVRSLEEMQELLKIN